VISTARTADLILMLLDAAKGDIHKHLLETELESMGIRLNTLPPNVYFKIKKGGGISYNAVVKTTYLDENMVYQILREYKIHNADIIVKEDITVDEFIDIVLANRKYIPCLYVYNKIDQTTIEEVDRLARLPYSIVIR
jgi:ribosome-interacting GTPase 1